MNFEKYIHSQLAANFSQGTNHGGLFNTSSTPSACVDGRLVRVVNGAASDQERLERGRDPAVGCSHVIVRSKEVFPADFKVVVVALRLRWWLQFPMRLAHRRARSSCRCSGTRARRATPVIPCVLIGSAASARLERLLYSTTYTICPKMFFT